MRSEAEQKRLCSSLMSLGNISRRISLVPSSLCTIDGSPMSYVCCRASNSVLTTSSMEVIDLGIALFPCINTRSSHQKFTFTYRINAYM